MFPNATPAAVLLDRQRRRRELHTTMAASYEVAARVHAELAAKLEAAGQRGRARQERELAAERTRLARQSLSVAAALENRPSTRPRSLPG
jgi:hypothetical protein